MSLTEETKDGNIRETIVINPINTQPTQEQTIIQQNTFVVQNQLKRGWTIQLCDCCIDCKSCFCSFCFFPCFLCSTYIKAGESCCDCWFGGLIPLRVKVRSERGIQGSICGDVWTSVCCPCCSLIQIAHEVENTQPLA